VVPYAKIKQQRFRRFKSAAARKSEATDSWDTNAITPGTNFMHEMAVALKAAGARFNWIVSDTDDPGEGEHKVLRWLLSTQLTPGPVVVYGLDADLILLCLLAGDKLGDGYPILLLREAMAFGKLVRPSDQGEVDLCFFKISTLRDSLQRGRPWSREQFYDYIFGMSFCGNDFLPTGLSLRIRDDGHAILLNGLQALWSSNIHLVSFDEQGIARPCADGLKQFALWLTREESHLILQTIKRKFSSRFGESEDDNLPLIERAEMPLVIMEDNVPRMLKNDWLNTYNKLAIGDDSVLHRQQRVADFWTGWCWVLDYYQGRPVDLEWVYPAGYPPTWQDLVNYFKLPKPDSWQITQGLHPQEQLALVLPISSWSLLLKTPFRNLPTAIPQFWPQGFALETFAKRFGWECEPMIPMLTPGRLRYEVSRMNPTR
jgi:5'-3' exonuclease